MGILHRWRHAKEGSAAIEGAIVIFAFVFLIFSIMEFLYIIFAYNTVMRAAENVGRFAMWNSPNGCSWLEANINNNTAQVSVIPVTITVGASDCTPGAPTTCSTSAATALPGTVRINAEYDFQSAGFFIGVLEPILPLKVTVCVPMIT